MSIIASKSQFRLFVRRPRTLRSNIIFFWLSPFPPFPPVTNAHRQYTCILQFALPLSDKFRIRPPFSPSDKRTPMSARAANLRLFGLVREALQIRFAVPTHIVTHLQLCTCSGGGHSSWEKLTHYHGRITLKNPHILQVIYLDNLLQKITY